MWTERVVADLRASQQAGLPFETAWDEALRRQGVDLRDLGVPSSHVDSLLDQTAATALEWWRGVCRAAYEDAPAPDGRPSRLRGVHAALRDGFPEREPVPVGRVRERPVAA